MEPTFPFERRGDPTRTVDANHLTFTDGRFVVDVLDGTITGEFVDDIDGAPTLSLSVRDYSRALLLSPLITDYQKLGHEVRIVVPADHEGDDDVVYRLLQVKKAGRTLTLTFEDDVVAELRVAGLSVGKIFTRGAFTRAQAGVALVRLGGSDIRIVCPEVDRIQRVALPSTKAARDAQRSQGFAPGVKLQGRAGDGSLFPMTADRLKIADRVLVVARAHNASRKATLALLEAVSIESNFTDLPGGDSSSVGVLQLLNIHLGGSATKRRNVELVAGLFLTTGFTGRGGAIALARQHPAWTAGQIAQACQGSAYPDRYDKATQQAEEILNAWGGEMTFVNPADDARVAKKYTFVKKAKVSVWETLKTWFDEVNWRRFAVANVVYLISEPELLATRPRMRVSEDSDGVDTIDFDIDPGRKTEKATIIVHAESWVAPAGSVVELYDSGPADGRWIVATRRRSVWGTVLNITLKRPSVPKAEPAAATVAAKTPTETPFALMKPSGAWGGTKSIFDRLVTPFMKRRGLTLGSTKRTPAANAAAGGSATSDHLTTMTEAYAGDYPTGTGEPHAAALARALGIRGWKPNDYTRYTITLDGKHYSVQILWGSLIDHDDHVHVGIRKA